MAGRAQGDLAGRDPAAVGPDGNHAIPLEVEPGHLTVLDQVDTELVRLFREGPGDVVMLRDAAAPLQRAADDRVTDVGRDIYDRAKRLDLVGRQPLGIDAVQAVGVDAPAPLAHIAEAVGEVEDAPLAEQDFVVELLRQAFPELERVFVNRRALVPEVIRADYRGVAGHVATAEPSALEDGDVADAVVPGQVIGGCQAVTAAAHDDDVIGRFGLRVSPESFCLIKFGHDGSRAYI